MALARRPGVILAVRGGRAIPATARLDRITEVEDIYIFRFFVL